MNYDKLINQLTIQQLAHALYLKGEKEGYDKVTDKTKWRELVIAENLGHTAHKKISAGSGSLEEGSDSYDSTRGKYGEYKSKAIIDIEVRNLLRQERNVKTGKRFAPLTVSGLYNGAYTSGAIDKYTKIDHYFGVFYKELCLLIIKVNTGYVIETLRNGLLKMTERGSTNCNTVKVNLGDTHLYDVVFKDEEWWNENK